MQRSGRRTAVAAALALALLFASILIYSILRRAETAYDYPNYSSLNAAEQGTKGYFEALARLGLQTCRNYEPLRKLQGSRVALFYAGPGMGALRFRSEKELKQFEQLANGGARVVIALDPEAVIELDTGKSKNPDKKPDKDPPVDYLNSRWGIQLAYADRSVSNEDRAMLKTLTMIPVQWRFKSWTPAWTPSQMRNNTPLFLERAFGKGAIVLIADSRLFTNRELLVRPDSDVLAAAPGAYRSIVFDETHLGLENTGTVIGLARAHGLAWILLGIAIITALAMWRSAFSFIPRSSQPADHAVSGRDAHIALSNLLRQSIPAKSVLRVAAEEWNRSAKLVRRASTRTLTAEDLAQLDSVPAEAAPGAYRDLALRSQTRSNFSRDTRPVAGTIE